MLDTLCYFFKFFFFLFLYLFFLVAFVSGSCSDHRNRMSQCYCDVMHDTIHFLGTKIKSIVVSCLGHSDTCQYSFSLLEGLDFHLTLSGAN